MRVGASRLRSSRALLPATTDQKVPVCLSSSPRRTPNPPFQKRNGGAPISNEELPSVLTAPLFRRLLHRSADTLVPYVLFFLALLFPPLNGFKEPPLRSSFRSSPPHPPTPSDDVLSAHAAVYLSLLSSQFTPSGSGPFPLLAARGKICSLHPSFHFPFSISILGSFEKGGGSGLAFSGGQTACGFWTWSVRRKKSLCSVCTFLFRRDRSGFVVRRRKQD